MQIWLLLVQKRQMKAMHDKLLAQYSALSHQNKYKRTYVHERTCKQSKQNKNDMSTILRFEIYTRLNVIKSQHFATWVQKQHQKHDCNTKHKQSRQLIKYDINQTRIKLFDAQIVVFVRFDQKNSPKSEIQVDKHRVLF